MTRILDGVGECLLTICRDMHRLLDNLFLNYLFVSHRVLHYMSGREKAQTLETDELYTLDVRSEGAIIQYKPPIDLQMGYSA